MNNGILAISKKMSYSYIAVVFFVTKYAHGKTLPNKYLS